MSSASLRAWRLAMQSAQPAQIRTEIEASALPSRTFFTMNALAAIIAGYGLLANSATGVIGAMLVAMMLGPISGIALALIEPSFRLLRASLYTLVLGMTMVYAIGLGIGFLNHSLPMTQEILSRTQPNLMDLIIALAGGAAGAMATISPRLSVAVVGVGVATALVPPMVASSILLSHAQWHEAWNAFLLALTNMVAIQISSSIVFWLAGLRQTKSSGNGFILFVRRNAISLGLLLMLTAYLGANFIQRAQVRQYQSNVSSALTQALKGPHNVVDQISFTPHEGYTLVRIVMRGDHKPALGTLQALENTLQKDLRAQPTRLQVRFLPTDILETGLASLPEDSNAAETLNITPPQ